MRCLYSTPGVALFVAAIALGAALSPCAQAQASAKAETADATAVAACERAARQTLAPQGAHTIEVTFTGAPVVQVNLSNESLTVLRGAGRSRSAAGVRIFNYSCNVDPRTLDVVGMVMRDSTPAVVEAAAPARPPAEPDLSELSPAACESSAVQMLQLRWPRVSKISFDRTTRTFRQQSASQAELHGSGLALPAPGSPLTLFGFDCAIDPRDGRVLRTSVSG